MAPGRLPKLLVDGLTSRHRWAVLTGLRGLKNNDDDDDTEEEEDMKLEGRRV